MVKKKKVKTTKKKISKKSEKKARLHKLKKHFAKREKKLRHKEKKHKLYHKTRKHKKSRKTRKAVQHKKLERISRVPTRISSFDSLIRGGFAKDSTNLILGGSGSGKSIFATQFLVEAMKKGERCLYVTFEEKKAQFYDNMKALGWDLEEYEKKGLFTFLEYAPIKVKTMLEEGGGSIESIILKKKITRMVIDSITSFALLFEDEFAKREAALSLFGMIRDWDCTSLLTLEEDPFEHGATSHALEFEVDSIIVIYYVREKTERRRYLEVLKMRGTDHSKKIYPFDIRKGGITIKRTSASRYFK